VNPACVSTLRRRMARRGRAVAPVLFWVALPIVSLGVPTAAASAASAYRARELPCSRTTGAASDDHRLAQATEREKHRRGGSESESDLDRGEESQLDLQRANDDRGDVDRQQEDRFDLNRGSEADLDLNRPGKDDENDLNR